MFGKRLNNIAQENIFLNLTTLYIWSSLHRKQIFLGYTAELNSWLLRLYSQTSKAEFGAMQEVIEGEKLAIEGGSAKEE